MYRKFNFHLKIDANKKWCNDAFFERVHLRWCRCNLGRFNEINWKGDKRPITGVEIKVTNFKVTRVKIRFKITVKIIGWVRTKKFRLLSFWSFYSTSNKHFDNIKPMYISSSCNRYLQRNILLITQNKKTIEFMLVLIIMNLKNFVFDQYKL